MQVPCSPAAGALSTPETPGVTAERALLLFEELQSSPARPVGSCSGPAASADAHLPRRAHELGSGGAAARKLREALTVVRPLHERRPGGSERYGEHQHDDSGLPYRLGVLGERVPAPAPWPPTGQIIEVTFWGALPRHGVAQPPAARSAAHTAALGLCAASLAQRHDQRPASTSAPRCWLH